MSLEKDSKFRRHLEHCDNIYVEVRNVMKSARRLSENYNNQLLHSNAISHVVRGDELEPHPSLADSKNEYEARHIRNLFCTIDDKEVCAAVYDSFYDSKSANHLIYVYNNVEDEPRKARVRVLTRMLWHTLIK